MDFVGRPQIISKDDVKGAPYVVGIRDRHMVGSTENEVYGYGMKAAQPDERFTILHIGDQLRDPDDGDLLGYMAYFAGTGEVVQSDNREGSKDRDRMAHLKVVEAGREILQGDKLFPAQADIGDPFVPSAPSDEKLDGQVIAIHDGVYAAGRYQVLALNRGKKHGLVPGNVVAIFQRGEEVRNRFQRFGVAQHGDELREGPPAFGAQRVGHGVQGLRSHELRSRRRVDVADQRRRLRQAPELRPPRHGALELRSR
jgi:hypothetical protein